jgi:ATP-dependent RNA helicase DeaD
MEENMFTNLGLNEDVLKAIDAMGFEEPSQIQAQAIPVIMQGNDIIGQAQTGTGKTLAFAAPILSLMQKQPGAGIQALILVPTRELSIQVNDEILRINRFKHFVSIPVYGGQPIDRQLKSLRRGVDIVVGTPGRILDHINRGTVNFSTVRFFVLDEADEMLNMGFIDDIRTIMSTLGAERQTMLFSATMPDQIRRLASGQMKPDVKNIAVIKSTMTVSLTEQFYFEVKLRDRFESLCRILDADEPESALIFCRTKKGVDELVDGLQSRGYSAEGMHGDMGQNQRLSTLKKFRDGNIDFLVATDVAARGIDIENISHVINYELPEDAESYVHRIGRTGRANRTGIAYSLVTPREYMLLKQIEQTTKSKIKRKNIPSVEDIYEARYKSIISTIKTELENRNFEKYTPLASELDDEYNLVDVAAALIKLLFEKELSPAYGEREREPQEAEVRLFMNVGRLDQAAPRDIVRFICDNAGITKNEIGRIDILDKFSFVNITSGNAENVIASCVGLKLCGRMVNMQPANDRQNNR